jgi:hypothetical protein
MPNAHILVFMYILSSVVAVCRSLLFAVYCRVSPVVVGVGCHSLLLLADCGVSVVG